MPVASRWQRAWSRTACTVLVSVVLTLAVAPTLGAQLRQQLPSPMEGIALTPAQREAIAKDWEQRRPEWDQIVARTRAAGRATANDRAALKRFVEARNAAVRALLTESQRAQLDTNLARMAAAHQRLKQQRRGAA